MDFWPNPGNSLEVNGETFTFTRNPVLRDEPYGQEGRRAVVYQIASNGGYRALKVFKERFRTVRSLASARRLGSLAHLTGLEACSRIVLNRSAHGDLIQRIPDLQFAVLMPWIPGSTWQASISSRQAIHAESVLQVARALGSVLATLESRGLAHGDLSGSNLMVRPDVGQVHLVDVDDLYFPGDVVPEVMSGGSPGYAHPDAAKGAWHGKIDRFAGAILLAEVLGWCDERVREASCSEHYFAPDEIQQRCRRLDVLVRVLEERWGTDAAKLLTASWSARALDHSPPLREWAALLGCERRVQQETTVSERLARRCLVEADKLTEDGHVDEAFEKYAAARELSVDAASGHAAYLQHRATELESRKDPLAKQFFQAARVLTSSQSVPRLEPDALPLGEERMKSRPNHWRGSRGMAWTGAALAFGVLIAALALLSRGRETISSEALEQLERLSDERLSQRSPSQQQSPKEPSTPGSSFGPGPTLPGSSSPTVPPREPGPRDPDKPPSRNELPSRNVAGNWTFVESVRSSDGRFRCTNRGTLDLGSSTQRLTGRLNLTQDCVQDNRRVATSPERSQLQSGRVDSNQVWFATPTCVYTGSITGMPPIHMMGTVNCTIQMSTLRGNWQADRGRHQ